MLVSYYFNKVCHLRVPLSCTDPCRSREACGGRPDRVLPERECQSSRGWETPGSAERAVSRRRATLACLGWGPPVIMFNTFELCRQRSETRTRLAAGWPAVLAGRAAPGADSRGHGAPQSAQGRGFGLKQMIQRKLTKHKQTNT